MTDFDNNIYDDHSKDYDETPVDETPKVDSSDYEDLYSSSDEVQNTEEIKAEETNTEEIKTEESYESSYEWNGDSTPRDGEYHYSYINGNNRNAVHNPNNYEDEYNAYRTSRGTDTQGYQSSGSNPYQSGTYNSYSGVPNYSVNNSQTYTNPPQKVKKKKERKPASRGFIAAVLAITILCSGALGFGGGLLAKNLSTQTNGNVTINQVTGGTEGKNTSSVSATTTSEIVKKTADSVVEIATEGVVTGNFAQQYVTKGAGSGVIISADGYIITNHHVIEDAKTIKVTLRDGQTSYDATLIGSDEDNDIALLKVNAEGLTPATFGDSSSLAVGDYVVAIGNPLGTLGGTVTDGIISALAREVTIEGKNMTLLQTNAQISPGNSGGGLFNANGELVGVVNAKDSATEVEGIAFAIPINNVIDLIKDLQNYGYVTGKIDLGMEFVDINSEDTAFYYGVNRLGCYVLSVTSGSNAEKAGFTRGDLITAVNGKEVESSTDISKALQDSKVGDTVTLTVSRSGQTKDIQLQLEEYVPSAKPNSDSYQQQQPQQQLPQDDGSDLWERIFGR